MKSSVKGYLGIWLFLTLAYTVLYFATGNIPKEVGLIFIGMQGTALVPLVLLFFIWLARGPRLKKIREERPNCVICDSLSPMYAIIATISLAVGVVMTFGIPQPKATIEDMALMGTFGFLCLCFFILFAVFIIVMWNRVIILDLNEIIFFTSFGKKKVYKVNQLENCVEIAHFFHSHKNQIFLRVNGELIVIEADGNCYHKALAFINEHYIVNAEEE